MKKTNRPDYVLVNQCAFIFAGGAILLHRGGGLINEVKIPVQELGGQRGEGAYFLENTVLRKIYRIHSNSNFGCYGNAFMEKHGLHN